METNTLQTTQPTAELLQKILDTEKKQLRCSRIRLWMGVGGIAIALIALVALLIGMCFLKTQIETISATLTETAEKIDVVAENLGEVDFAALDEAYQTLAASASEMIETLSGSLDGLQSVIENADIAMKNLADVDIKTLNESIQQFNEVLAPLAKFFGVFNR